MADHHREDEEESGVPPSVSVKAAARNVFADPSTGAAAEDPSLSQHPSPDEEEEVEEAGDEEEGTATAPSSSSGEDEDEDEESSSSSSSSTSGSENEDSLKRYPIFTPQYAKYCNYGLVPFIREGKPTAPPAGGAAVAGGAPGTPSLILYGEYLYEATLGKGTYSKVIMAVPLRNPHADVAGASAAAGGSGSEVAQGKSAVSADGESTGSDVRVALKIFRNKETYREACWDEMVILSLLCGLSPVPSIVLGGRGTSVGGGLAEYTASLARFIAPIAYIPHPMHPALVLPLLGPSTLRVSRKVKQASRDIAVAEGYDIRRSPNNKRAVWYRGLPLALLKSVLYQILIFLQYSHSKGIVHTDLKPENVLFESIHRKSAVVPVYYHELTSGRRDSQTGNEDEEGNPSNEDEEAVLGVKHAAKQQQLRDEEKSKKKKGSASSSHKDSDEQGQVGSTENSTDAPNVVRLKQNNEAMKAAAPSPVTATRKHRRDGEPAVSDANFPFFTGGGRAGDSPYRIQFAHNVTVDVPHLPSIRVVDLGAAQLVSFFSHISRIDGRTPVSYDRIQTKHYVSPEVLLCTGWSASADMFSLGCMIPELLVGDCVFMPQHRVEHLALMEHVIGPFSEENNSRSASSSRHTNGGAATTRRRFIDDAMVCNPQNVEIDFDTTTKALRWPLTEKMLVRRRALVAQYEKGYHASDGNSDDDEVEVSSVDDIHFVRQKATLEEMLGPIPLLYDLARRMLTYHPLERISPVEALRHPFFHSM